MGRWAKSHDQRKGQWLYNALRPEDTKANRIMCGGDDDIFKYKSYIADRLFNMSNEEFDKFMENYIK